MESEEPPSKLQANKRSNDSIRKSADTVALALCTKLRQRSVLGALCAARPAKQQIRNQVARETA